MTSTGDNPARPLRIEPEEEADEEDVKKLATPSVSRSLVLCTVGHREVVENLDDMGDRLKARMGDLKTEARRMRRLAEQQERERERSAGKEEEYAGIDQFKEMHSEMDRVLNERVLEEIETCG